MLPPPRPDPGVLLGQLLPGYPPDRRALLRPDPVVRRPLGPPLVRRRQHPLQQLPAEQVGAVTEPR